MPIVNLLATRAMIFLFTWRRASFLLKPCKQSTAEHRRDKRSAQSQHTSERQLVTDTH
jgi:hypothetical protein